MTSPMIGSRPVVGSSKKMISGSAAMARARPTFLHAARQLREARLSPTSGGNPTEASFFSAISLASCGRRRALDEAEGDVLPDLQAVEQRRALEQHAELAHEIVAVGAAEVGGVLAVDEHGALIRLDDADDAFEQDRFAGARTADHHQRLAGRDLQVDAVEQPWDRTASSGP